MKFLFILFTFAAGLVAAQKISDIPACAQPCIVDAVSSTFSSTKCSVDDYECICLPEHAAKIAAAGAPCVVAKCGSAVASSVVLPAVEKFCDEVNAQH
ncbi:hypothetical protein N0V85_004002 [Neurospora sp. IMI 360204]|nr:hypothetical protein N0V85_004002 [Neurospora sp. IMI 360204]